MTEGIEVVKSDLKMIEAMFAVLEDAAAIENVNHVTITCRSDGGDTFLVGYGESAEPALLHITPAGAQADEP